MSACTLTLYSRRSLPTRELRVTNTEAEVLRGAQLRSAPLQVTVRSQSQVRHCKIPQAGRPSRSLLQSPLRRLHPQHMFSIIKEAADSLLSGERQLFPPRPRAPGSGARRPAALLLHRHSHQNTWARNTENRGDEARGRKRKRGKAKSSSQLGPLPRRL